MSPFDLIILVAGFALAPAYICRLDALKFGTHRAPVVLLHLVLFVGCISSGYHAWTGVADLSDVAAVSAAGLWLANSWPTWARGVPHHAETQPAPLDDAALARVVGGRSSDDRGRQ